MGVSAKCDYCFKDTSFWKSIRRIKGVDFSIKIAIEDFNDKLHSKVMCNSCLLSAIKKELEQT